MTHRTEEKGLVHPSLKHYVGRVCRSRGLVASGKQAGDSSAVWGQLQGDVECKVRGFSLVRPWRGTWQEEEGFSLERLRSLKEQNEESKR